MRGDLPTSPSAPPRGRMTQRDAEADPSQTLCTGEQMSPARCALAKRAMLRARTNGELRLAGLEDSNTIDLVGKDAEGTFLLVMIEERPWGSDPNQADQLMAKISAYAGYVLDGDLVRQFPETAEGRFKIQLECVDSPDGHFSHIIDHAVEQLANLRIEFEVRPRGIEPDGSGNDQQAPRALGKTRLGRVWGASSRRS
jgi:hypothetical protein